MLIPALKSLLAPAPHYLSPRQDLLIPCFKEPSHYQRSIYMGGLEEKRDILFFFR